MTFVAIMEFRFVWIRCQATQSDGHVGKFHGRFARFQANFVVLAQAPITIQMGERPLHDPTLADRYEARLFVFALVDFQAPARSIFVKPLFETVIIALYDNTAIAPNQFHSGTRRDGHLFHHQRSRHTVVDQRRGHNHGKHPQSFWARTSTKTSEQFSVFFEKSQNNSIFRPYRR